MRSTKPKFYVLEEDICDIAKILNKPNSLAHEAMPLAFITNTRNQELFTQVPLPPKGIDVEDLPSLVLPL